MNNGAPAILGWMTALADATRARILRLLERHELTVAELCAVLQLPQSTVSRHLKALADERLGGGARRGHEPPLSRWPSTTSTRRRAGCGRCCASRPRRRRAPRRTTGGSRASSPARQTPLAGVLPSAAGQWDRLRRELFGERFDLAALAGLLDDDWVVGDLGCGTGQIAAALAPFVRRVIAVDSSRAMLQAARQRLGALDNVELRQRRARGAADRRRRARRRGDLPRAAPRRRAAGGAARGGARAAARRPAAARRHAAARPRASTSSRWATSGSASRRRRSTEWLARRRLRARRACSRCRPRRRPRARRCSPPPRGAGTTTTTQRRHRQTEENDDEQDRSS